MPDELWMEVRDIVQEIGIKTIPKKKKCKKAKWLSEEALQIAVKRREVKSKGEKERYIHSFSDGREFILGHHQMVDSEIRLIIFFAAKDGEALYSQQKQE